MQELVVGATVELAESLKLFRTKYFDEEVNLLVVDVVYVAIGSLVIDQLCVVFLAS